jgi:hypothetical protein
VGESICAGDQEGIPKHEEQHLKQHKTHTSMSYMTKFIVSFILLSDTVSQCCYMTEDNNRVKIDPNKLRNGLDYYASSSDKAELYGVLARYVRKVYPDTDIKKDLKNNEGFLFIDRITPSDIAFVISIKEWS